MVIFGKNHIVRRFTVKVERGRESVTFSDALFCGDVQNPSDSSTRFSEGGRRESRLKVWTDEPFTTDDQISGKHADWIWSDGCWWQCKNCRYAKNTILAHYISEFVRVPENEPEEYLKEPEVQA